MRHIPLSAESIRNTLGEWKTQFPQMGVLALLPEAEKTQLPLLQEACRQQDVPLVGAIFPALVTAQGFVTDGVWLLRFDRMPPTALIAALDDDTADSVRKISTTIRKLLSENPLQENELALYMLFDGMVPNIASILDGIYLELADRVSYAGANAGSESFQAMPCLFDQSQCVGNGLLCLLLPGESTTVLEHGFSHPEKTICATSTDGNRITLIDWRPAFEVYRELIKAQYDIDLTRENFYQHAVHFPLGILRASAEVVVRIPVALTEDGSLYCVGEVPENAILVLLRAPAADADHCMERLARNLAMENGPLAKREILTFYCAGRRMHLGLEAEQELGILATHMGAAVFGGALSLGEIGSSRQTGYPTFHNATLVCTPWGQA